ncbi:MAG: hypothetical protein ABSH10_06490 [Phycisphaerae bacterium]|jgi:hypothetical protein
MADTRDQLEAENWVRNEWMPSQYGQKFSKKKVPLTSGGVFEFDAVSDDGTILAAISTSEGTTSSGRRASGKVKKIYSDIYFLLLTKDKRRIIIFTEQSMHERFQKEKTRGRVDHTIEFVCAELPETLINKLRVSRKVASQETGGHEN